MLIGLEVDPNPLVENRHHDTPLEIIYEDPWIVVVNKPAGMLSVPGKSGLNSVLQRLQELYPESDSPLLVHRLDMDTSGLLLAAKRQKTYINVCKPSLKPARSESDTQPSCRALPVRTKEPSTFLSVRISPTVPGNRSTGSWERKRLPVFVWKKDQAEQPV